MADYPFPPEVEQALVETIPMAYDRVSIARKLLAKLAEFGEWDVDRHLIYGKGKCYARWVYETPGQVVDDRWQEKVDE